MRILKSLLLCFFLYVGFTSFGQEAALESIRSQFATYQQQTLQEKLYVHTDKTTYLAGEILWLKVYYVDVQNKPLDVSKVAYVDVLDKDNKFLVQAKLELKAGSGAGSVFLPFSAATGNYTLRGYTNWMKNFGAGQFFQTPIAIINTLKAQEPAAADTASNIAVRFFPEGGNLVTGLESRVAVQVVTPDGKGTAFTGTIVNENGDSVASVRSLKFGIGTFDFTPQEGHTYNAVITSSTGRMLKKELPAPFAQGYIMKVVAGVNGKLTVTVAVSGMQDQRVYLVAHSKQQLAVALEQSLRNGQARFEIDTTVLAKGVSSFTIFNEARKPVCERLYFKKPTFAGSLRLASDQPQYGTRKKVELTLQGVAGVDSTAMPDLSLAVFKNDALQDSTGATIASNLWLTSELSGRVEAPGYYFSDDAAVVEATDNLMLTHGWRRFRWEQIFDAPAKAIAFAPEVHGHLIKALVTDIQTRQPAAGVITYLSVPGNPFRFLTAKSDSNGVAAFDLSDQYGPGELIFQTGTETGRTYRVELLPAFAQTFTSEAAPRLTFSKAHIDALLQQSINMQVQHIYSKDSLDRFQLPQALDTVPFYGKPDYSYALDLYTRFPTMEEVMREYVLPINVVQRRGGLHLLMMDDARRQFFDGGELVLVDGIPLLNADNIFAYDPLKVKKLDVITHKYFIGPTLFNGIASFTTYNGNYEGLQLDPNAIVIDFEGLQLEREFYAPVYETAQQAQSRVPDFRSTLLWQPHVGWKGSSATISFYTSDVKGSYMAEVQGLDNEGHTFTARLPFEVN